MNKTSSTALGVTVAIALTTGSVLVEHQSTTHQAPGAHSDITIVKADGQKVPKPCGRSLYASKTAGGKSGLKYEGMNLDA